MATPSEKEKIRRAKVGKPGGVQSQDHNDLWEKVILDLIHAHRDQFDALTDAERQVVLQWLTEVSAGSTPRSGLYDVLWEMDFVRKPVGVREFIQDNYYLGKTAGILDEIWIRDLEHVFGPGSPVVEWIACLHGDTRVPLLDGSCKTLRELHADYSKTGKPIWVYSYRHEDGQVVPGEATRVVRFAKDQLYMVTLDDGSTLKANADHELVCRDGIKRMVRDLKVGDRLMPFTISTRPYCGGTKPYEEVYIPGNGKYAKTHRMVARMKCGGWIPSVLNGDRCTIHHRDFNSLNNHPDNLEVLGWREHQALHMRAGRSSKDRQRTAVRASSVARDRTSPFRIGHLSYMRSAVGKALARANLAQWKPTPEERRSRLKRATTIRWDDPAQRAAAAERMRQRNVGNSWSRLGRKRDVGRDDLVRCFGELRHLGNTFKKLGISRNRAVRILREHGETIADLKGTYRNHAIVSIEPTEVDHVYCLTVPAYGNFAISTNGRNGIFSGNTGSIGCGKTSACMAGLAYKIYWASCLRDPNQYFGQLPRDPIVFGIYSVTKKQSNDAGYSKLREYIDNSPYFTQDFPRDTRLDSWIRFKRKPLQVIVGSRGLHSIGLNILGCSLDEANFMQIRNDPEQGKIVGQAYDLYHGTKKRIISRFMRPGGTIPGILMLISSRSTQTDFLEEKIKEARGDPTTYVSDYPLWAIHRERYSGKTFRVEVGDRTTRSRIIGPNDKERESAVHVDVPVELQREFVKDLDGALRDMAGVATFNMCPLIHDRQSIGAAVRPALVSPFDRDTLSIAMADTVTLQEAFNVRASCVVRGSRWVPRLNPSRPRHLHVDIGFTEDCLGIAMGHISGLARLALKDPRDETVSVVEHPFVVMDFLLRVTTQLGSEIDLGKILSFIVYLRTIYPLKVVTFDGYQSRYAMQELIKAGFESYCVSMDRDDEAYTLLRGTHYERRIAMYDYPIYQKEMLDLRRDVRAHKVDHPAIGSDGSKGTKDVADAVAGVNYTLHKAPRDPDLPIFDLTASKEGREGVQDQDTSRVSPQTRTVKIGTQTYSWEELAVTAGR